MNFDQAVFEMSLEAKEARKLPANIVISFEARGKKLSASLRAKNYYRDTEGTLATVKRAWECYCRGDEDKLYGITSIVINYEGADDGKEESDKRITA